MVHYVFKETDQIIATLQKILLKWQYKEFKFNFVDSYEQDDYLHLVVKPDKPGIRASEYVEQLNRIEAELRNIFNKNIIIIL